MQLALQQARLAAGLGEVPIGAVLVSSDKQVLGLAYNRRELDQDVTAHAEMLVLRAANRKRQSWRLSDCSLFVTLEPCFMCAAAIQQARIHEVIFAAYDPKSGAVCSHGHFFDDHRLNHQVCWTGGVLQAEAGEMLQTFFRTLRRRNKVREQQAGGGRGRRRQLAEAGAYHPTEPAAARDEQNASDQPVGLSPAD
ncbi:nucleoside deaminase [Oscillospiraceae bacterium HV4-5-C5C]|nr:nucleoside deaminase [Oscillospiraceae bacterium HV4-5-C5C]